MAADIQFTETRSAGPSQSELLEEVADLSSGLGLAFTSFLAVIPGLLPMALLTVAALAIVAIPMVVVGIAAGVVYLLVRGIARLVARIASVPRPSSPESARPTAPRAAPASPPGAPPATTRPAT
jgi:hypothetical protein